MVDVFSREQRSEIMSKVKGSENRATELRLMEIFRDFGIHGWRRRVSIFGKPDFVFYEIRLAIFVDGCFWHGCRLHGTIPDTNSAFWVNKLTRNRQRDRLVGRELRKRGWRVVRSWQHELRDAKRVSRKVKRIVEHAKK